MGISSNLQPQSTAKNTRATNSEASGIKTLTGGVAASAKGSYTEMIASAAADVIGLLVTIECEVTSNDILVDIATGAGGAEAVKVANLYSFNGSTAAGDAQCVTFYIPLFIGVGVRIAAACSTEAGGSQAVRVAITALQA